MAAKSQAFDNDVLNRYLRNGTGTTLTPAAVVYAAIFTLTPTPTTSGTEVVDTNYTRQACTFGAASAGVASNTGTLAFFGAGAATAVGSVVAVAVFDAASGGNMLYFGNLSVAKTIGIGDTMSFAGGALSVTEQ